MIFSWHDTTMCGESGEIPLPSVRPECFFEQREKKCIEGSLSYDFENIIFQFKALHLLQRRKQSINIGFIGIPIKACTNC